MIKYSSLIINLRSKLPKLVDHMDSSYSTKKKRILCCLFIYGLDTYFKRKFKIKDKVKISNKIKYNKTASHHCNDA